jgi:hypothetical protein
MTQKLALAFAEAGFALFPVRRFHDGLKWRKKPHIKQWQHRASADPRQVEEWWRVWPNALPGIALARCGLVVVDCDRHGGPDGVAAFAELGPMPPHPIVITPSNGEHRFFAQTDPPITSSDAFAHLGIDILGSSHFVVGYDLAPLLAVAAPVLPEVFRTRRAPLKHSAIKQETPTGGWLGTRAVVSPNSREGRYAKASLHNAFGKLANWPMVKDEWGKWHPRPGRNTLLNKLAFKMGGLVANGWIDEALVIRVLMLAAKSCRLEREDGEARCLATIASGLRAGIAFPYPPLEGPDMATTQPVGVPHQKATGVGR